MKSPLLKEPTQANQTRPKRRDDYWIDALRVSELRYRRLFETAQDGILILDADRGEIMDVNPFLIDLLDYPFDELRGRKLWEIGQFKDIAANRAAFEKLLQNEYTRYDDLPLRRKDGRQIPVEFVSNVYWVGEQKVIQCNIRALDPRAETRSDSRGHLAAVELALHAKDAWLSAHVRALRTPLGEIALLLGLMELGRKLAGRRPNQAGPSLFDQAALPHVRRNFQGVVRLFNRLSDLTGQDHLRLENHPPSGAGPSLPSCDRTDGLW